MNELTTQTDSLRARPNMPPALAALLDDDIYKRLISVAKDMANANGYMPPHLLGKPAICFAVLTDAITWNLNPYAVAKSTYDAKGKIAYEGKLVQAILEQSGQIEGGIKFEHFGDWDKLRGNFKLVTRSNNRGSYDVAVPNWGPEDEEGLGVTVKAKIVGESEPREWDFLLKEAHPRNAVTWATRPSQQICYTAIRAFANLVVPSLLMGVPFTTDESAGIVDITPDATVIDNEPERPEKPQAVDWWHVGFSAFGGGVSFQDAPGYIAANDLADWQEGWSEAKKQFTGGLEQELEEEHIPETEAPTEEESQTASASDEGAGGELALEERSNSPAQDAGLAPRSLDEMVAACKTDMQRERLRVAHRAAEKGTDYFQKWLDDAALGHRKLIDTFLPDLRAIAEENENGN